MFFFWPGRLQLKHRILAAMKHAPIADLAVLSVLLRTQLINFGGSGRNDNFLAGTVCSPITELPVFPASCGTWF